MENKNENKKTNTEITEELIYKCEKTRKNNSKKDKPLTDNDIMKYEIASELGLIDKVSERGWAGLTAKEAGKIKHIGITSHGLETVEKAVESGKFETIQFPYNIVENQADEVFKKAHEKGVGTIVMKPLAGGAIDDGTLAMKYILSREYIDVAIPGMDTPEQVKENTAVLENFELTEEDNVKITKIKSELGTNFCRRCEYCLPCPQGVIIPQNFLLEGYYTRYGLQDWAIDRYKALGEDQRASNCVECGACESKCPYELPIIEMLKNVVNTLEK